MLQQIDIKWEHFFRETYMDIYIDIDVPLHIFICLKGIEAAVYHAVAFSAQTCESFRIISDICGKGLTL